MFRLLLHVCMAILDTRALGGVRLLYLGTASAARVPLRVPLPKVLPRAHPLHSQALPEACLLFEALLVFAHFFLFLRVFTDRTSSRQGGTGLSNGPTDPKSRGGGRLRRLLDTWAHHHLIISMCARLSEGVPLCTTEANQRVVVLSSRIVDFMAPAW